MGGLMSGNRFVWYWMGVLVAALGVMRLVWNEFPDLQIDNFLSLVLSLTSGVVDIVKDLFEEPLQRFLDWVLQYWGVRLWLQYHWVYAFALLQLFLGNYAVAQGGGRVRLFTSFLFAIVFGVLTGTVDLSHPSVLFYPLAGSFLFAALGGARAASVFGLVALGGAVYLATSAPTMSLFPGLTKSFGLAALIAASVAAGLFLAIRGLPRAPESNDGRNVGRQMGVNILVVLLTAATLLTLSWLSYRLKSPTTPFASNGGFRDCKEAYCPEMKAIPADTFDMGSDDAEIAFAKSLGATDEMVKDEKGKRKVTVRAFAMSVTEVTREQFEAFVKERPYKPEGFCWGIDDKQKFEFGGLRRWDNPGFPQEGDHPAVCVTWHDAKAYAAYLTRMTGHRYRLPSEAEWEYAARAGTATSRYWGQENAEACKFANVADATAVAALGWDPAKNFPCADGFVYTAPVGRFQPNAFGLHDMLGNVWEWTEDCYNNSYIGAPSNGSAWLTGDCSLRVIRGGSWYGDPRIVRSAIRVRDDATYRNYDSGFRVARTD